VTPFGIRRRIKRLLGMPLDNDTAEPEAAKATLVVSGPKGEQSAQVNVGLTLLAAAGALPNPIASGCSDSSCGTCRVEILEGAESCSEAVARERATLKENGFPTNLRLACRTEIVQPGTIKVKAFELM
jgi:ferredoxin